MHIASIASLSQIASHKRRDPACDAKPAAAARAARRRFGRRGFLRGTAATAFAGLATPALIGRARADGVVLNFATYGGIAKEIGEARASRAVGAAVGRNPISWLIPCHRVLAADGTLHGYHWGLPRKRAMLAVEAARAA